MPNYGGIMQITEFISAIKQLADEKGLSEEVIIEAVESALAAAYRKDYGKPGQIIRAALDIDSNTIKLWRVYNVLEDDEELTNDESQLTLEQAKKIDKKAVIRNKIKRSLARALKEILTEIKPGYNFIFIVKKEILEKSQKDLEKNLKETFKINNLLK